MKFFQLKTYHFKIVSMFGRVNNFRLRALALESKESHLETESDCTGTILGIFTMLHCFVLSFNCWSCFVRFHCSLFSSFEFFLWLLKWLCQANFPQAMQIVWDLGFNYSPIRIADSTSLELCIWVTAFLSSHIIDLFRWFICHKGSFYIEWNLKETLSSPLKSMMISWTSYAPHLRSSGVWLFFLQTLHLGSLC